MQAEYTSTALTLLRYDFERPHGQGVLDHSQANVRRYHDVEVLPLSHTVEVLPLFHGSVCERRTGPRALR